VSHFDGGLAALETESGACIGEGLEWQFKELLTVDGEDGFVGFDAEAGGVPAVAYWKAFCW
jgi:hypothetical protein